MIFSVFELPKDKKRLDIFDKNLVKGSSVLKEHREVSLRLKLPAGSYVIVPCTRNPGEYGPFTLSLYFSINLEDATVTRLDKDDECKFISLIYILDELIDEETESF